MECQLLSNKAHLPSYWIRGSSMAYSYQPTSGVSSDGIGASFTGGVGTSTVGPVVGTPVGLAAIETGWRVTSGFTAVSLRTKVAKVLEGVGVAVFVAVNVGVGVRVGVSVGGRVLVGVAVSVLVALSTRLAVGNAPIEDARLRSTMKRVPTRHDATSSTSKMGINRFIQTPP